MLACERNQTGRKASAHQIGCPYSWHPVVDWVPTPTRCSAFWSSTDAFGVYARQWNFIKENNLLQNNNSSMMFQIENYYYCTIEDVWRDILKVLLFYFLGLHSRQGCLVWMVNC